MVDFPQKIYAVLWISCLDYSIKNGLTQPIVVWFPNHDININKFVSAISLLKEFSFDK
jgi:hypothetical protein